MADSPFRAQARAALADERLQAALAAARPRFVANRAAAFAELDFAALRECAARARQRSLDHLELLLAVFARRVEEAGGHVHFAETPDDLRKTVVAIARRHGARLAAKGKSMVAEEADLNAALASAGITPVETDLGEYIIQLARERPSHIVCPALHKDRHQVAALFRRHHPLGERELAEVSALVEEARQVLRGRFLEADLGITGANLLVAETGTAVLCTNEGNGDLAASLPDVHVVVASLDKVVANWADAAAVLRVLARSATGQPITTYTSCYGPRRPGDRDGPRHFHVVLLDNGRSGLLGGEFESILRCIRCAACLNHCPVYQAVGGHAYGSVYPGPMGAVLTPLLRDAPGDAALADASTLCGRCEEVCPVAIPLPQLLRGLRAREARRHPWRGGRPWIRAFALLSSRPGLYRLAMAAAARLAARLARAPRLAARLPLVRRWAAWRDLPPATGRSFGEGGGRP